MPRRQPPSARLPRLWLFTDERVADAALLRAVRRLPRGSGVVFRHYGLESAERGGLFATVAALTRRRGLVLLAAGQAPGRGAAGTHCPAHAIAPRSRRQPGLISASAHNLRELAEASRAGAHLVFLSPVFATRSHPGGRTLGPMRFAMLAHLVRCPVIALGGMNAWRFRRLKPLGAYGWAAIDALS